MITLTKSDVHLGQLLKEWAVAEQDRISKEYPQPGPIVSSPSEGGLFPFHLVFVNPDDEQPRARNEEAE
jgi:hypothetical protein